MIEPYAKDAAFLQDVRARVDAAPDAFRLWWLGQSGFLLQWNGRHLLLDPYLSDSLTEKYSATDKPHERLTARVVAPEKLDFVDVVTSKPQPYGSPRRCHAQGAYARQSRDAPYYSGG